MKQGFSLEQRLFATIVNHSLEYTTEEERISIFIKTNCSFEEINEVLLVEIVAE